MQILKQSKSFYTLSQIIGNLTNIGQKSRKKVTWFLNVFLFFFTSQLNKTIGVCNTHRAETNNVICFAFLKKLAEKPISENSHKKFFYSSSTGIAR